MAHHKRRRAKAQRAGCLLCKPWKIAGNGSACGEKKMRHSQYRKFDDRADEEEVMEARTEPYYPVTMVLDYENDDEDSWWRERWAWPYGREGTRNFGE